jgi:hypothetical protein
VKKAVGLAMALIMALSTTAHADAVPTPTPHYVQAAIENFCSLPRADEPKYVTNDRNQFRWELGFMRAERHEEWRLLPPALKAKANAIIDRGRRGC